MVAVLALQQDLVLGDSCQGGGVKSQRFPMVFMMFALRSLVDFGLTKMPRDMICDFFWAS